MSRRSPFDNEPSSATLTGAGGSKRPHGASQTPSPATASEAPILGRRRPSRPGADIPVALTEREVRALVRATDLVLDVLRPEMGERWRNEPPVLSTARAVLTAAAEREGFDLGALVAPR